MGDQEDNFDVDDILNEEENAGADAPADATDNTNANDGGGDNIGDDAATDEDEIAFGESTSSMLNQGEIDELLGFEGKEGDGEDAQDGIDRLIEAGVIAYERMPMLEVVYDRLVRVLSTSLRNFTSDNVEVTLSNIETMRFGSYAQSISMPALLAIFKAEEWDNFGMITMDSSLVYSIVDVLLGGRMGTAAMRMEGRNYTTIERNLVERMVELILTDMSSAFDPVSAVNFRFDRLESNPRFAQIAQPANASIIARFTIDLEKRGGKMEIVFPYATLEPVREQLMQLFSGEKFGVDTIWENHIIHELWDSEIYLDAEIERFTTVLGEVMKWKAGTFIPIDGDVHKPIMLSSGKVPLFEGKMGRSRGNISVKIDRKIVQE